jgi:phosphate acetyltransferase
MEVVEKIYEKAKKVRKTIVLPEAPDPRVIEAAESAVREGLANIILVGKRKEIKEAVASGFYEKVTVADPEESALAGPFAAELYELRKGKGMTMDEAVARIKTPLYFGAMMVRKEQADGMVTGAATSSSDVLRTALQVVGCRPGIPIVSSCQIMDLSENPLIDADAWAMADCVVNIDPDAEQLAVIAVSSAETMRDLLDIEPKVAMLSFSTKGSAKHGFIDKVVQATKIAKEKAPFLLIDGEIQFDAAVIKSVGETKCPGSPVAGEANVLIFPDIQSGNIGYKIVERVGGAQFVGCIIQGLNHPVNDLSRGCNAKDILNTIAITAVQAQISAE